MLRNTILVGLLIGVSAAVPLLYQANPDAVHELIERPAPALQPERTVQTVTIDPLKNSSGTISSGGRKVEIAADERGHYTGEFKINGRRINALIDTGATAVAVNISTARRLGVSVMASDMTDTVNTANGKAKATIVQIDRIEIGRIVVENVPAIVLEDDALGTTLVGMTFLSRLKKFEANGKTLRLVQ